MGLRATHTTSVASSANASRWTARTRSICAFVTPLDIALRMGAPFLVERGIDPSEEGLGPALIMRLLLDLPQEGGYFRALADQPPMAEALWSTIRELRMCGVKSADLHAEAFASPAKHAEMRALLAAYERYLETNKRGDVATVYEEALKHQDWCPVQPQDCWTELPDVVWPPLQQRLIDAMPGERIDSRGVDLTGATRPRRMRPADVGREGPPLRDRAASQLVLNAADIDLFHAGGREAEIEEVFRRVLQSGLPLDDIEIACASSEHASLAWEKALRHEWPVTIGPGLPVTFTRPGRALLAFCEWIEGDFHASTLRRLLQSGDVRFPTDAVTPGQAARLLVKAEAAWGRATYDLSLSHLARSYLAAAANKDLTDDVREASAAKAQRTEALRAWTTELAGSEYRRKTRPRRSPCRNACPLRRRSSRAAPRTRARSTRRPAPGSSKKFRSCARSATSAAGSAPRCASFANASKASPSPAIVRDPDIFTSLRSRDAPTPAAACSSSSDSRRDACSQAPSEDPVLLDQERARIHAALRLSKDRVDEAVWATLSRLATHAGPIVLSYSSRDVREYRETYASWLMLQAFRLKDRRRLEVIPRFAQGTGRGKVRCAHPARGRRDGSRVVARQREAGRRDDRSGGASRVPGDRAGAPCADRARVGPVHRVRRVRSRSG